MACLLAWFPDCLHFVPGQQPVAYLIYCFPNSWPHTPSDITQCQECLPLPAYLHTLFLHPTCFNDCPQTAVCIENFTGTKRHQTNIFSVLKLPQVPKLYAQCRNQFLMTCCQPLPQSQACGLRGGCCEE